MRPIDFSLDDKYTTVGGRVFMTGVQALVRLPMLQRLRDEAAGLDTAGFVSGYRGSPLGALDLQLQQAREHLARHRIVFQPGINEDLAATAVWGTQQVGLFPGARHQGVFAMWYGKGPGVDRSGDVFRHGNAAGSSRHGGVLVVAGDDHAAKSSTLPHQTEHIFKGVLIPVLAPANVQEYLDYGLHGWAMSRYSGCWVAFKALADTVETSASVLVDPLALDIRLPTDVSLPEDGLNIRWPDPPLVQEARLLNHKLYAALAYCRANRLNRVVIDSPAPRLGIISAGKSYLDVRQALDELGIDDKLAARIGIRLYKVGMVWPLEADGVRRFAEGLEEILVVEEKRQMLEYQLKEELYNWREDVRPKVIGKFDDKGEWALLPDGRGHLVHGDWLLPAAGELSVAQVARVIAGRIERFFTSEAIRQRLALIEAKQKALSQPLTLATRTPYFCAGCPHNTSTRVPEGSRAVAGIGCHYMVTWMDRATSTFTHMGGEGVPWVGQAPFTDERHIFANLGDGTYFHSGILAIRQSVAAGVNITYKLLYNDAVAMTGGQAVDGKLTVPSLTRQLEAEGVSRQVIVTDEPEKYATVHDLAPEVPVVHRDALDRVQRELRDTPGTTILIYDQTCATEKRRRRKRGRLADPPLRVVINEAVCEGCGDCSAQSNCLAIVPIDTEFGRKRAIDQSSCNKDFSCLKGFCPSFVTIHGHPRPKPASTAKSLPAGNAFAELPEPRLPALDRPFNILVTGVGGTGVITIGALLGTAAHIEGRGISVLDMTGLAQKYGAVFSHIRIAADAKVIHAARIATGDADAVIAGDLAVTAGPDALSKMLAGRTRAVVNCTETPTAEFTRDPDWQLPADALRNSIAGTLGADAATFIDAHALAVGLLGDALVMNSLLLGFAWQRGLVPLTLASIDRAIEVNGVAVARNREALLWGRYAAVDGESVHRLAGVPFVSLGRPPLDERISHRAAALQAYQNEALAQRYRTLVERVRGADTGDSKELTAAVAEQFFRLLAVKDEYEVARLLSAPEFLGRLRQEFVGEDGSTPGISFHLAVPLLARTDPDSGRPRKRRFGAWLLPLLRLLAALRILRGTVLDPFGHTAERRTERRLADEYERDLGAAVATLSPDSYATAVALARLPESIRGYGPVKAAGIAAAAERRAALRQRLAQATQST
jgi:indolepyruvate ferredoxin oxidoreductase